MTNLYVCTECFGLTSRGSGMQRCSCEEYKTYPGVYTIQALEYSAEDGSLSAKDDKSFTLR